MKRRLFVLGYFGYYNLGDDLMLELINQDKLSTYDILVLSRRKYYKCKLKYINRYNIIKYFFSIRKNDILINLGGIFQDKTGIFSFIYYFFFNFLFILKKGKIVFLNTDFLDVKKCQFAVHFLLKNSSLTVLRSKVEYNKFKGLYNNIYYIPDMVFLTSTHKFLKSKSKYILISLRKKKNIDEVIQLFRKNNQTTKFLLMKNEKSMIKKLIQYGFKKNIVIYNYFNKEKIFYLIFNADKIITMRYHVGILGLLWNKKIWIMDSNKKIMILNKDYKVPYYNKKKNIDKTIKREYINVKGLYLKWADLIDKVNKKVF